MPTTRTITYYSSQEVADQLNLPLEVFTDLVESVEPFPGEFENYQNTFTEQEVRKYRSILQWATYNKAHFPEPIKPSLEDLVPEGPDTWL